MRFALVGPAYPYRGGIAHYTTSLCKELEKQHKVLLISFSRQYPTLFSPGGTQRDPSLKPFAAEAEPLLDSLSPCSWRKVAGRLLTYRPDLVLFQWWQPFFGLAYRSIVRRFKRKLESPVFFLCHNVYGHEKRVRMVERPLISLAFRNVDGFLVHSEKLAEEVQQFNKRAPVKRIDHPVWRWRMNRNWPATNPTHRSITYQERTTMAYRARPSG